MCPLPQLADAAAGGVDEEDDEEAVGVIHLAKTEQVRALRAAGQQPSPS